MLAETCKTENVEFALALATHMKKYMCRIRHMVYGMYGVCVNNKMADARACSLMKCGLLSVHIRTNFKRERRCFLLCESGLVLAVSMY